MILFMAALVVVGSAMPGQASKSNLVSMADAKKTPTRIITLAKGMAQVIDMPGPVADLMVANPTTVDVTALQSNKLYVVGLNYGTTNVIALDTQGNVVSNLNVHVKIDDLAIQETVRKLFPGEDIKVTAAEKQIILTGHVSTPDMAQKVANVVGQYTGEAQGKDGTPDQLIVNLLTVAGEQQVMLRVKVIEASRDTLRELGLEANSGGVLGAGAARTGGFTTTAASGLTADPLGVASVVFHSGGGNAGQIQLLIRALERNGLVNTLAEPNLTAISGEQAGFLAGGEYPVPTSRDQNGNVIVQYKPFGVALNFKPTVMSDDRISLQLQTEVSAVSSTNTITTNALVIPGFSVRRAATTVEMGSGGSLMIAGLLQSDVSNNLRQLPGIKDIPILGALLSSQSFERNESELVVIVTAYLVKPYGNKDVAGVIADGDPDNGALALPVPANAAPTKLPPVDTAGMDAIPLRDPTPANNPLAVAFANNMRQTYSKAKLKSDLFSGDGGYGYLIK